MSPQFIWCQLSQPAEHTVQNVFATSASYLRNKLKFWLPTCTSGSFYLAFTFSQRAFKITLKII